MPRSSRDAEFSAFAQTRRTGLVRSACLRPGLFDVPGDSQILTFQIAGGRWVIIQAPVSLGWNSAELAQFASGVQVLVTAQQGRA